MKRLFYLSAIVGFLFLSSCGSTESCRTRKSAYKMHKKDMNTSWAISLHKKSDILTNQ